MKKGGIIFSVIIILVLVIFIVIKFKPFENSDKYSDIALYKNGSLITLSESSKTELIKYVKREKFNKYDDSSAMNGTYKLIFNNIEVTFNENGNICYYKNGNNFENYGCTINSELVNYTKQIAN